MSRDYIILMGPGHYSGPIEVTAVKVGESLEANIGKAIEHYAGQPLGPAVGRCNLVNSEEKA